MYDWCSLKFCLKTNQMKCKTTKDRETTRKKDIRGMVNGGEISDEKVSKLISVYLLASAIHKCLFCAFPSKRDYLSFPFLNDFCEFLGTKFNHFVEPILKSYIQSFNKMVLP